MSKVLVTGGAGYIGSHTCLALANAGIQPVVYDNLARGNAAAVIWGPLEHGDILDRARLDEVMRAHRPDAVLHFAAMAYVSESMFRPELYYRTNVTGSLTLLQACLDNGIGRVVFSSTCATYGIPPTVPISEETPQHPISPYGRSKLMVEQILSDLQHAHQLQWLTLRYFNAAGADPDCRIGELHVPETHLIPLALDAAATGGELTVHGVDYETPDGTCIRDYVHVSDLADAHVSALQMLASGQQSGAMNLGTERGASVNEVIAAVTKQTGRKLRVREGSRRPGDPPVLICNSQRARQALNWTPKRSSLDEIVSTAWAWRRRSSQEGG